MRMNQSENIYVIGSVESLVEDFLPLAVYIYKEHSTPEEVEVTSAEVGTAWTGREQIKIPWSLLLE